MNAGYKDCCQGKLQPIKNDCDMILIEETTDVSRERFWIAYYRSIGEPLMNINLGEGYDRYTNHKKWIGNNKERYDKWCKEYAEKNKEKKRAYARKHNKHDPVYAKEYYSKNKESMNEKSIEYKKTNKEQWNLFQKLYKRMKYWEKKHKDNPKDIKAKDRYEDLVLEHKLFKENKYKN